MDPHKTTSPPDAAQPVAAPPAPRPSGLLMVNSAAVIVISLMLASAGIRGLTIADPHVFLFGLVMFPLAAAVGLLEYAASFRRSGAAAKVLRRIHTIGFILCLMASVYLVARILFDRAELVEAGPVIVILLLMSLLAALSELGNRRWLEALDIWQMHYPDEALRRKQRPFQVSILELLLAMNVVALVAGMATWMIRAGR